MPNPMKKTPPNRRKRKDNKDNRNLNRNNRALIMWFLVGILILYFAVVSPIGPSNTLELSYKQFVDRVKAGDISQAVMAGNNVEGTLIEGGNNRKFKAYVIEDSKLVELMTQNIEDFTIKPAQTLGTTILVNLLPVLVLVGFLWFFVYRQISAGGGKVLSFGKSRARLVSDKEKKVTFDDVAGVDEAKEELMEIVEFLKDPKRFQKLGGKIPKGVILIGPPGTGKTLLARAVAGQADVSFFTISGSDFVEMFVGVGASRVRDTFDQARKSVKATGKGSILFIDEIDAVGRSRGAGIGGGHDEREQTLNALLVEMDGFDTGGGVIIVAATNRPDVLDPALLRAGRFDRTVVIDRPDIKGREGILKVHTKHVILDKDVNLNVIARQTSGFSGADLANLVNEGALLAARRNLKSVSMKELEESLERVMGGLERRSRVISDKEKRIVSVHESGHALLSVILPHADPCHKVSIIPRGVAALGYTMNIPLEDRYLKTRKEFTDNITVLLGGRVAEIVLFDEPSTGAQNDFDSATEMAHRMVCEYGMSDLMGTLTYGKDSGPIFLARDFVKTNLYSEKTLENIDSEVKRIVDECYAQAMDLLTKYKKQLEELSSSLLEREVLVGEKVREIVLGKKAPDPAEKEKGEDMTVEDKNVPENDSSSEIKKA